MTPSFLFDKQLASAGLARERFLRKPKPIRSTSIMKFPALPLNDVIPKAGAFRPAEGSRAQQKRPS
jgi:hypothetical protein